MELRPKLFGSRTYQMRHIQAFMLLATMLSSPLLGFAEAISQSSDCCCCGTFCPMHKSGSSRRGPDGKPLCGGARGGGQQCNMAACNQHADSGILQLAPEAILSDVEALLLPGPARMSSVIIYAKEPSRFILPLEKPPRR